MWTNHAVKKVEGVIGVYDSMVMKGDYYVDDNSNQFRKRRRNEKMHGKRKHHMMSAVDMIERFRMERCEDGMVELIETPSIVI